MNQRIEKRENKHLDNKQINLLQMLWKVRSMHLENDLQYEIDFFRQRWKFCLVLVVVYFNRQL